MLFGYPIGIIDEGRAMEKSWLYKGRRAYRMKNYAAAIDCYVGGVGAKRRRKPILIIR